MKLNFTEASDRHQQDHKDDLYNNMSLSFPAKL